MQRRITGSTAGFTRALTAVAVVCSMGALSAPVARAQSLQYQSVTNSRGSITGVVSDDHGGPIAGAMVSALGTVTVAKALTDATGYFSIDALPAGDYTVQAHRNGFVGSARATVRVSGLSPALQRLQLRRLSGPVATTGTTPPSPRGQSWPPAFVCLRARSPTNLKRPRRRRTRLLRATIIRTTRRPGGFVTSSAASSKTKRQIVTVVDSNPAFTPGSLFERAMDSAASLATTFFTDLPFSGEVNLLTTGAFGPGEMFSGDLLPRGVAYMAIGAPTPPATRRSERR